ncbi:MAG: hypothetical protein M3P33_01040 [bacterium]|nr:hypothetical protein [bacterium]
MKKYLKHFLNEYLIITICALTLTTIWFSKGLILATGESGLPFYNPTYSSKLINHTWASPALGNATSTALISLPFFLLLNLLSKMFPYEFLLQALIFFLLLITPSIAILKLLANQDKSIKISATLFYMLNPIALISIWNRMQYPFIFLYALIPLGLYCFIAGIKKQNIIYSLILNIVLLIFSIAFASIPLIQLFWLLMGMYVLSDLLISSQKKSSVIYSFYFLFTSIFIWTLLSLWWILPFTDLIASTSFITQEAYNATGNLGTFNETSRRLGDLSYVFRMMNREFYLNMQPVWGNIYFSFPFVILSYSIPTLVFFPLLLKRRKPNFVYVSLIVSLVLIFFIKGSNPPFGEIFSLLISNIRFLEVFRNPYEKIGIGLPLAYAPLIGYSLYVIKKHIQEVYGRTLSQVFYSGSLFLLLVVLVFPFWNRWLFLSNFPPANDKNIGDYVLVPKYYGQANSFLNDQKQEFRTIALPLQGEGINHTWKYGYAGVEVSNGLFDLPFLSLSTSIQFLPPIADSLEHLTLNNSDYLYKFMQITNSKYIMIRQDIDHKLRRMTSPQEFANIFQSNVKNISFAKTFGELKFYQLNNQEYLPKIYTAHALIETSSTENSAITNLLPFSLYDKGDLFISESVKIADKAAYIKQEIYTPKVMDRTVLVNPKTSTFLTFNHPTIHSENALVELPYVKTTPDSPLYFLIRMRENHSTKPKKWSDKQFYYLRITGKRLVEVHKLLEKNAKKSLINQTSKEYSEYLMNIDHGYIYQFDGVRDELYRHYIILDEIKTIYGFKGYPSLQKSFDYLQIIYTKGIPIGKNDSIEYRYNEYEVIVPTSGVYDVLFYNEDKKNGSKDIPTQANINGIEYKLYINNTQSVYLNSGVNHFVFPQDKIKPIQRKEIPRHKIIIRKNNSGYKTFSQPKITFSKLNQALYQVTIKSATDPFVLVFSETFHPLWQLNINGDNVKNKHHFRANSYANAWYIDKAGDYVIQLKFKPEDSFTTGKLISAVSLAFVILCTIILIIKKKKD